MRMMLYTMILGAGLALTAPPLLLAADPPKEETPELLAREGMERLMRALELFIDMIPQYEAPELNDDGDIIIRRKRRPDGRPLEPDAEDTKA